MELRTDRFWRKKRSVSGLYIFNSYFTLSIYITHSLFLA